MNRRSALRHIAVLAAVVYGISHPLDAAAQSAPEGLFDGPKNPLAAPWAAWKAAYLAKDGRVIDAMQQGASHSESQGYGLALAALFGDNPTFDLIYAWTEANLAVRSDALLAWRWLPADTSGVPDLNNASDGDLFYAWGLVMRATRDGNAELLARARAIAADLVARCVVPAPDLSGRVLLLPAAQGFQRDDSVVINLSYYMPLAMREVALATGENALATCAADGSAIMHDLAGQGPMPDWIEIGPNGMAAAPDHPDNNGYEAMRVPLFLLWSGARDHAAIAAQAAAYRRANAARPLAEATTYLTVIDRHTGAVIETSAHVGYGALVALVDCVTTKGHGSAMPYYRTVDQAYYPATLHLMALIAQITAAPECVPI